MLADQDMKLSQGHDGIPVKKETENSRKFTKFPCSSSRISICLVCYTEFQPEINPVFDTKTRTVNDDGSISDLKIIDYIPVNYSDLFDIFCIYMNLSSQSKTFEGSSKILFCKPCEASLIHLLESHRQLEKLVILTNKITATITTKIVESCSNGSNKNVSNSNRPQDPSSTIFNENPHEYEDGKTFKTERKGTANDCLRTDEDQGVVKRLAKINGLRQLIYEQYNVKVNLSSVNLKTRPKVDSRIELETEAKTNNGQECEQEYASDDFLENDVNIPIIEYGDSSPIPSPLPAIGNISSADFNVDFASNSVYHPPEFSVRTRRNRQSGRKEINMSSFMDELFAQVPEEVSHASLTSEDEEKDTNMDSDDDDVDYNADEDEEYNLRKRRQGKPSVKSCTEVSPGNFLFFGRFLFHKIGDEFQCGTCLVKKPDKAKMLSHCRTHSRRRRSEKQYIKLVEVSTNIFLYGNKYFVKKVKDRFKCCLCGKYRNGKYKLLQHIRVDHIRKENSADRKSKMENSNNQQSVPTPTAENQDPFEDILFTNSEPRVEEKESTLKYNPVALHPPFDIAQLLKVQVPQVKNTSADPGEEDESPASGSAPITYADILAGSDSDSDLDLLQGNPKKRYVETEPNKFLYANEYIFEKIGEEYRCHACSFIGTDTGKICHHIRETHVKDRKTTRVNNKWVEVTPGRYLYAHKYFVEKIENRFKCCTCEHTTKGKYKMFEHLRTRHINPVDTCICDTCGKQFGRRDTLNHHKKYTSCRSSLEGENDEMYICSVCGKTFKNMYYLRHHERLHGGNDKKRFQCSFCGQKFWGSSRLKDHMALHTGEKSFQCPFCDSKFTTYNNMHYHRLHKHGRVADVVAAQQVQADLTDQYNN